MATAAAATTLGISATLVATAVKALGIAVVGAVFTGTVMNKIKEWIKTRDIDTNLDAHVMKKNMILIINVELNASFQWQEI